MRSIGYKSLFLGAVAVGLMVAGFPMDVAAGPSPNSAVIKERVFNDCLTSVLTTTDNYPALIAIDDDELDCVGFANRHNWRFSEDDTNPAVFNNGDSFRFCATLTISGTAEGEAGLQISPWWSQDVDGVFNVRTTDGEIACFGGRLPFYSFSGSHGLTYVKGTTIYLEMTYRANDNTAENPGTIEYQVTYNAVNYSSGEIAFDEGNPDEDPPYGVWGILNDARAGGHIQCFLQAGNPNAQLRAEWADICYEDLSPVPVQATTWGKLKNLLD